MLILHETYDHWSVAVLTVTVHSSFLPTFDFFKYVAFCTGFNLLTTILLLPNIIMDLPIFVKKRWLATLLVICQNNRYKVGTHASLIFGDMSRGD